MRPLFMPTMLMMCKLSEGRVKRGSVIRCISPALNRFDSPAMEAVNKNHSFSHYAFLKKELKLKLLQHKIKKDSALSIPISNNTVCLIKVIRDIKKKRLTVLYILFFFPKYLH